MIYAVWMTGQASDDPDTITATSPEEAVRSFMADQVDPTLPFALLSVRGDNGLEHRYRATRRETIDVTYLGPADGSVTR
jgi:hypothetical protein